MTANPPARSDEALLVTGTEQVVERHDPQEQRFQQNLSVALIPLGLVAFVILTLVLVAWTFLAAA
jgi:hypothetical protein